MSAEQDRGGQVTRLRWGSATDVGRVRTNNQDSSLVALPLFAVADGMGGQAAGEVANRLALDTQRTTIKDHSRESRVAGVKRAKTRVFEKSVVTAARLSSAGRMRRKSASETSRTGTPRTSCS